MKNGGQAFPLQRTVASGAGGIIALDANHMPMNQGMTMRQYYKAAAIQGILTSEDESFAYTPHRAAHRAGEIADAMLREDEEHDSR